MTIAAINVRNQFRGKIKEIIEGPVVSEVDVETPAGLIVTSVITTRSVKELGLAPGTAVVGAGEVDRGVDCHAMRLASTHSQASARLMIVPGLNDSPPDHWQSWLQTNHRDSVRVTQHDWHTPDVDRWAARIGSTVARSGRGPWIVVAHSFGVLALARHLALDLESPIAAALLVAPADPDKFGIGDLLPAGAWPARTTMVLSHTDPWLGFAAGQRWAARWGCHVVDLGDAGHVNVASGFRTLPFARRWVGTQEQRLAREARPARASILEWAFSV